jgi:hypothetical protein
MADDIRIKYLDTRKALDNAMADVTKLSTTISKFSKSLQGNPWNFDIGNNPNSAILNSFKSETWPTGKEIISKLTNLTTLYKSLNMIWNSMSESDRSNLERPADLLGKFHP